MAENDLSTFIIVNMSIVVATAMHFLIGRHVTTLRIIRKCKNVAQFSIFIASATLLYEMMVLEKTGWYSVGLCATLIGWGQFNALLTFHNPDSDPPMSSRVCKNKNKLH
jgi:hypothetical protein